MSATPELVYFGGRGRAEIIRLILAACSLEFKDVFLQKREQYLALKPDLLFGQVPLLKIGGKNLVQTFAIARHLARTYNLYGKDEDEKTIVDIYFDGTRDFYSMFYGVGFSIPFDQVKEKTETTIAKYLPLFDSILKSNGSNGYLVGESLTLADLGLLEVLLSIKDYHGPVVFAAHPEIEKFLETICQLPFYEKYFKEIRKPINSAEYIASVKEVLAS